MPLAAGARIAHFEVVAAIGAGGMGEVYRARDLDLGRDVALKVLPEDLIDDASRLVRFEREARAAAALNHPNILVVFEVGASASTPFVAFELLEGQTLSLAMHRPLGVRRSLDYATQVARGLAAAHDKGIVHRDIKPSNLFVTSGGVLKILDFGIARVGPEEPAATSTLTAPGAVLGTTGYMAPEQVRGEPVDARADVFALGAVCYEMLTGRRAFPGSTSAESLAATLKEEPPEIPTLNHDVSPAVARIVHRCLEKAPGSRFQSAHDLAFALESALVPDPPRPIPTSGAWWRYAALAAVAVVAGFGGSQLLNRVAPTPPASALRRAIISPPGSAPLSGGEYVPFALSPDGTRLAYVTSQPERLLLRRLDEFAITEVAGAEGAFDPFFSPDGQWIGFWAHGEIKKVPVAGGPPVVLCKSLDMLGASWGPDGSIVFAGGLGEGLSVVSADGGAPQPLTALDADRGELHHGFPQVLGDGRAVLFTAQSTSKDAPFSVELYDVATKVRRTLVAGAQYGRYLPTGHLVYVRNRMVLAARVAPDTLQPTGPAVTILDDVQLGAAGAAPLSVAKDGTLAYVAFDPPPVKRLVWVDRSGKETDIGLPARAYVTPRLSPDGRSIAVRIADPPVNDIWIASLDRMTLERLTFGRRLVFTFSQHAFSPDGSTLAYSEDAAHAARLVTHAVDGRTPPQELLLWPRRISPAQFTRKHGLLLVEFGATTGGDLMLMPPGADRLAAVVQEPKNQWGSALSPDERFVAYAGEESGRYEIYVAPVPGPGAKRQLTADGGVEAVWSRDGREIYYRNADRIMAIPMTPATGVPSGRPRVLFEDRFDAEAAGAPGYDVAADGRFLMMRADAPPRPPELRLVLRWFEDLNRRVP